MLIMLIGKGMEKYPLASYPLEEKQIKMLGIHLVLCEAMKAQYQRKIFNLKILFEPANSL